MQVEIALALGLRPVLQAPSQEGPRLGQPLAARSGGEPARQDRLGLVVEGAQQLALPAVPDARPDGADIAHRQHQEQLHAVHGLHDLGEVVDGAPVCEVARLGDPRHGEMLLDQPGDELGLVRGEAETRTEPPRHLGAGDRVVLRPPLGDVVQEERYGENRHLLDGRQELVGERVLAGDPPGPQRRQRAHRTDQVLVHRVVVIHVELHHRDDLAEVGDEATEHAGLVHVPEHRLHLVRRRRGFPRKGGSPPGRAAMPDRRASATW